MARMVEIAELQEKWGRDWYRHYSRNPFQAERIEAIALRLKVIALYLGIFVLFAYACLVVVSPVLVVSQGLRLARIERELAAERRLVDRYFPPRPMIEATR